MAKTTLEDLAKVFKTKEPKKDFHYYGQIVSVDQENRTYQVSINRDENITVEAARLVGAGVGDTVMVTVMANGYATVTGRVGGDMDASDAQRTADNASDAASSALSQANSAVGTATQAQTRAGEALNIANDAVELAEQAEEEAGRASTAATQAATSAQNAESSAARAATSASNAEGSASSAATAAANAETDASNAADSASRAATSAANAESDASDAAASASNAATSASNAEGSASRAATSASNAESSASSASTSASSAASSASSAATSASNAASDAATASQQSSAATTAANEAKTQAQAAETAASEAKADASSAKRDAAAANTAANGAVAGLAVVQGVVDQLETDVDDMQTHVAMMNAIDDGDVHIPAGLHVVPSASGYFMVIANDGVYVYDNESVLVAKYGHNIVYDSNREHKIGNNTSYIRYYDSNNDGVADAIEIVADNIRLGSYSVGDKITATETTLNNYMSSNNTRVGNVETSITTTTTNLTNYITSNNQAIENLQGQIDGSIQTWFYEVVPTNNNPPAVNWTTTDLKNNHLGDLYYDTITGYCYRYQVQNNVYGWQRITDVDVTKALADAAKAQDTADHKRRVFVTTPAPPYEIGDLWVQGQNGDIFRCATPKTSQQSYDAADWVKASKYTDDTKANAVESDLHTNYYVKSDFSVAPDQIASTISATETTVKTYADGKASAAESSAKTYADGKASTAETNAKTYADGKASTAESNAKTYADGKASAAEQNAKDYADDNFDPTGSATTALNTAKTYADGKASTAETNAKAYADDNFDPVGSAASALDDAKDYADDNFDTKGSASAAQSAAISAAATDATTKANNAKDAAISAAATDATTKANSAKNAAITAAAEDATSKANAAEANAKADTTEKLKSYYTKTQTDSAITQSADNILSTVSTTYQTKDDMDDYSTTAEMNSAINQKADAITSTVSQTYATKTQAQGYADTAESNAISAAATDATNKANAAKQEAIADAASKYYTKTQTYTKSEIEQKAGEISLSVAREEVEKIEIGGRNLFAIAGSVPGYLNFDGSDLVPQQSTKERTTDYIPVDPNSKYCLQAWYDPTNPTSSYEWVCVQYYTSEKEGITQPIRYHMTDVNYKEWILTLTSDTAYVRISSRWVEPGYEYAKVKFEKGNKFTDWTPAPEDLENYTDTKITEAKAEIKVTTDAIESTVSNKVGNNEVISKIRQSAETVKIKANQVEIDGAATFNAIKSQADAAYDAKNSAATAESNAKTYADGKASTAETNAKTYADGKASTAETNAKTYADGKASTAETNAKTYADGKASTAETNAKTYADGKASTKADKTAALSRSQRIYYRSTSIKNLDSFSGPTTWLSTSGTGYENWSLSIPQLTNGEDSYPYLYTCVQNQTAAQYAAGSVCTCTPVVRDDSTTVIDGGSITTGVVSANYIDAAHLQIGKGQVDGLSEYMSFMTFENGVLKITKPGFNYSVEIRNDGVYIVDPNNHAIASYKDYITLGTKDGNNIDIRSDSINFNIGNQPYAYVAQDKWFASNAEVSGAMYIDDYSLRQNANGDFVLGRRK